ncbi:Myb/SANT-like DNA-binding domain-containing protein 1 [Striga asiatica]|uniref:Myb/SANT-like DNA-binding domain-containing protein 1 n=1 Tax=Striga asiatica TaxID=4170 RepID=A0A5A7P988_STRAF|nr:Myb/SANT-like DNA-binding domain-containing protein 1 [Striga asiatica]
MAQSASFAGRSASSPSPRVIVGRDFRTFFFRPLLAASGTAGSGDRPPQMRRIQVQRETMTRPRTQMRAQRKAARITTKSELRVSTAAGAFFNPGGGGAAVGEGEATPARWRERAVMCEVREKMKMWSKSFEEGKLSKVRNGNDILCLDSLLSSVRGERKMGENIYFSFVQLTFEKSLTANTMMWGLALPILAGRCSDTGFCAALRRYSIPFIFLKVGSGMFGVEFIKMYSFWGFFPSLLDQFPIVITRN